MREKFSPSLFQKAGGVWGNAPHKQTDKSKFEIPIKEAKPDGLASFRSDKRDIFLGIFTILFAVELAVASHGLE